MIYFCGDIHGNLDGLNKALEAVGFDKEKDTLICTGDLVDRGTQNEEVVYLLDERWFRSVRGNHDQWCVDSINDPNFDAYHHIHYGGSWFYSLSKDEQYEVAIRLASLPFCLDVEYEGKKIGVVHAEVPYHHYSWTRFVESLKNQNNVDINCAMWGRHIFMSVENANILEDVDIVIHGHTGVPEPAFARNRLWIDTGAFTGDITVISAEDALSYLK